jgi:hypothetical protein
MFGNILLHNRWGFLQVDYNLGKYYRRLFFNHYLIKLQRPSNEEHITIVSPWDNIVVSDLHEQNGRQLKFEVDSSVIWWNGNAFWLDVISEQIDEFRKELGLCEPGIGLHFCIGYLNQNEEQQ